MRKDLRLRLRSFEFRRCGKADKKYRRSSKICPGASSAGHQGAETRQPGVARFQNLPAHPPQFVVIATRNRFRLKQAERGAFSDFQGKSAKGFFKRAAAATSRTCAPYGRVCPTLRNCAEIILHWPQRVVP